MLSECEFRSLPALLLLNYCDSPLSADSLSLQGFSNVALNLDALVNKAVAPAEANNRMKNMANTAFGNLYV